MTPAVLIVSKSNITFEIHEYVSQGKSATTGHSWGSEAAEVLGVDSARVFKTIVLQVDASQLCVGIVPVASEVNLKALASAAGGKKAVLAPTDKAQRSTGYVLGGISPLGRARPCQPSSTQALSSSPPFLSVLASAVWRSSLQEQTCLRSPGVEPYPSLVSAQQRECLVKHQSFVQLQRRNAREHTPRPETAAAQTLQRHCA